MKKSEEFIEGRIRWKGEKHKLPYPFTYYWENASYDFRNKINLNVGKPVIVSAPDITNFVVLCTQGIILKYEGNISPIFYSDIDSIQTPKLNNDIIKSEIDMLELHLKNGHIERLRIEKGAAYLSIFNMLLMLLNLSR